MEWATAPCRGPADSATRRMAAAKAGIEACQPGDSP